MACSAASLFAKKGTFHFDALVALGLKDCTFNNQTQEIDASSLSAGTGVADGEEEEDGAGETLEPCDLGTVEE